MNFSESKTFCPLPWINISADTDGSVRLCCVSDTHITKPNGENYNLGYDKIEDIINSSSLKQVRDDMLNGRPISGCKKCYDTENSNGVSYRKHYIDVWKDNESLLSKVNQSLHGDINTTVEYYDLRYGNLCNLSCRSCYPPASSQFDKDIIELQKTTNIIKFHEPNYKDLNSWYETETFSYNLYSQLSNIKEYYSTGGEPTINDKNFEVISKMIETGDSKHCTLKFNTNLTNTKKDFYSVFKYFKNVILMGSIDGYREMQEYLRYPSNWNMISSNIDKLVSTNLSHVKFTMSPVIQITNLGYIVDLFEYLENYNKKHGKLLININPIILVNPSYLDLTYLPLDYKIKCWGKIEHWINNNCKYQGKLFHSRMNEIKTKCYAEVDYIDNLKTYFEFTDIFDKHRSQNIQILNPELSALRAL
jgi:sulfatase maturation enzyme AslB (radical SAM superfamily)